jgi:preprotein translocase subunit Sec61beta
LWGGVLVIAGAFQFYRGAPDDGLIFGIGALLLLAHYFWPKRFVKTLPPSITFLLLTVGVSIAALSKIHTRPQLIAMVCFATILLVGNQSVIAKPTSSEVEQRALVRSRLVYALLAVLCSIWEMLSYILETHKRWSNKFPTISELTDPMMHHTYGRVIFLICFGLIGYGLFFSRKKQ